MSLSEENSGSTLIILHKYFYLNACIKHNESSTCKTEFKVYDKSPKSSSLKCIINCIELSPLPPSMSMFKGYSVLFFVRSFIYHDTLNNIKYWYPIINLIFSSICFSQNINITSISKGSYVYASISLLSTTSLLQI